MNPLKVLITLVVFGFLQTAAHAAVTPCLEKHNGKWQISTTELCVQYTHTQALNLANIKAEVESLAKERDVLVEQNKRLQKVIYEWEIIK